MTRSLLASALAFSLATSSVAFAQDQSYDDPQATPQAQPKNGERKRVRYVREDLATSDDTVNLRFYLPNLLVGLISADVDFRLGDFWTFGPSIGYWNISAGSSGTSNSDFAVKMFRVGARANWFKNGVFTDGLFIGPSIDYSNLDVSVTDSSGTASAKGNILTGTALIGYGWFWNSFNMMLGVGGTVGLGATNLTVRRTNGTTEEYKGLRSGGLAFDWSFGWTF